ncbi:MAG: VPGUxxT family thioredoxin-like (seleno)protein, type 2 [Gemmataceae bacterium]
MTRKLLALVAVAVVCWPAGAADKPVELGKVPWLRDYDQALKQAAKEQKLVFILFDEVPGCHTCQLFGTGPLSHPVVVDAAARCFVPVAVYNNVKGKDLDILKQFKEPAWNNPVFRFLDAEGKDIIPRKDGVWTTAGVLARMVQALEAAKQPVPDYLRLVADEHNPKKRATATFAMFCYWEGEKNLGKLDGVLATRIGMLHRAEVVEVDFDPERLPYEKLVAAAQEMKCASKVFTRNEQQQEQAAKLVGARAQRTDEPVDTKTIQQYHLAHSPAYHYLPLTALQATKVNAALASREAPDRFRSPGQLALQDRLATVVKADRKALASLKPDRTAKGLIKYHEELERTLAGLEKQTP